ncbi:hypothetical protein [Pseudonocardia spinosispora]|uniref:hypothetical protein n=1 Tax=Pseudonocardia spinosispora TaxID=103441 RepID=UPI0012EBFC8E|nr:hypothetical protein [Pseudonocardia spinosispora]
MIDFGVHPMGFRRRWSEGWQYNRGLLEQIINGQEVGGISSGVRVVDVGVTAGAVITVRDQVAVIRH